ncbi:hybrid sensor histidine kinase/response regulator transcription factor [uncultured Maribacter sp.]|uniref:hybrid sensor histidine kinase/response regulator transcription factor n=1 Tax=uncultured Maribacter sp. TaxID=431308 RepID=UPI00261AEB99|nr:hybrid sensor histidine kinase/response regulator transcription factor [uncultured Maribacter sp.]
MLKQVFNLFFLFYVCLGFAQIERNTYHFKHLNTSDGLSQSSVIAIEQDKLGRMWLGTRDGLNLYDGKEFTIYRNINSDSTSISNSDILSIKEDSSGYIWVGTYNGLNRYDPVKDSFKRFYHFNDKTSLCNNTIWAIEELSNGEIWIGTSKGISIYDKNNDNFINVYTSSSKAKGDDLPSNYVLSIKEAKNGTVWIGTSKGLFKVIGTKDSSYDFTVFKPAATDQKLYIQDISACDENTLCIGTKNMGLLKFDLISERFLPSENTDNEDVRAVEAGDNGMLWVGSSNGITLFDKYDNAKSIKYEPSNRNSLSHNYIKSIYKDKKGSIWIGSYYGGVDIWDISNANFINYTENFGKKRLGHKVVSSIVNDDNGNLYFGTEGGGFTIFNEKQKTTNYINTTNSNLLQSDNVKSLMLEDGILWIGTFNKGVKTYNIQNKRFENNLVSNQLKNLLGKTGVYTIKKGINQDVWLGTFGYGLIKYNTKDKTITEFGHITNIKNSLSSNRVRSILVDKNSNIWIGTQSGLNLLPHSEKGYSNTNVTRFFYDNETDSGDDILFIYQDSNGVIWLSIRAKGLYCYDGRKFKNVKLGLNNQITSIYSILEGEDNTLLMSSNQGILKYNIPEGTFVVYTKKDGIVGNEFSSGAALKKGKSKFYFGGPEGVSYFDASKLARNSYVPQVILTNLKIKNSSVSVGEENGVLSQSMPFTKEIILDYDKANFSIDYSIPNFINPESNQYKYRLVGLEDNWVVTNLTRANYTIQKPGEYIFEVKGANNDRLWNSKPTSLVIIVKPAPWLSSWAFLLYALFILIGLLGLYNIIKSKTKLKHKLELEHLENERNQEINDAKLRFFTNISHEFRTPLTLITGPLQQLLENYKGSRIVYKKLLVIESNANHLLQLINRLMDFRKLEHKKYSLAVAEGNLVKFLREIFLSFSEFAKVNNYTYSFETSHDEILVFYDRSKLEQVFYNLISNAFKYTPANGSIEIVVRKEKQSVKIEVIDSGPGIPKKYKNKVFERFFEIPEYITDNTVQSTGTGIGLSIAKSIIELHKGYISFKNREEKGSVFIVELKLGSAHIHNEEIIQDFKFSDDVGLYTSQLSNVLPEKPFLNSETIILDKERDVVLVVEDNVPLRRFIKDLLKDSYNILEANNGKEAMVTALKYVPSLIISDVIMPEMVGTELCAKIKENIKTSHIPVVLLTSRTSLLYKYEGLESGADDYISKPFNIKEFKLRVKNLIDSSSRMRAKFSIDQNFAPNDIAISSLDEQLFKKALFIVEENISNNQFDIITFTTELGISRTLLFTKIKAWTNFTPNEFIQEIRMKRAAQLLEKGSLNVSEISYMVGFKNPKYFSKCFQKKYGLSPSSYIDKFSENLFDLD